MISARTIVMLFIICASIFTVDAQINLVHNPSLEDRWQCPNNLDQIYYAKYWSPIDSISFVVSGDTFGNGNCTPEYCNVCNVGGAASAPSNARFFHYPRTGDGMAQIMTYVNDTESFLQYRRDYLQGRLKTTLHSGTEYCVTFYTTLEQGSGFAINNIGAYLDDGTIDTTMNCGLPQTTHIPQIYSTAIINDTLNWVKIQGTFTANGSEKFITIGNFTDDAHTDTIFHLSSFADFLTWYLVDDVSVIPIDAVANAGPDVGIPGGDSAWIGNNDGYLPCKWYYASSGALIDSNHAGMWVHPTMTTSYVMELDVCGVLSYDTVTVHVYGVGEGGSPRPSPKEREVLLPNPARDEVCLTPALSKGEGVAILRDMTGKVVLTTIITLTSSTINIESLPSGVYIIELIDGDGVKSNLRLVKE